MPVTVINGMSCTRAIGWFSLPTAWSKPRVGGDEIFGERRLRDFAVEHRAQDAELFCDRLLETVRSWSRGGGAKELEDDLTLLVVDVH